MLVADAHAYIFCDWRTKPLFGDPAGLTASSRLTVRGTPQGRFVVPFVVPFVALSVSGKGPHTSLEE